MSSVVEVSGKLDTFAAECDERSKQLAEVERRLEKVEPAYEDWIGDFEADLLEKSQDDGSKMPREQLTLRLAHRSMPKELLGEYRALMSKRKRLEQRISHLGKQIDAQRSILSALKSELEAVS